MDRSHFIYGWHQLIYGWHQFIYGWQRYRNRRGEIRDALTRCPRAMTDHSLDYAGALVDAQVAQVREKR